MNNLIFNLVLMDLIEKIEIAIVDLIRAIFEVKDNNLLGKIYLEDIKKMSDEDKKKFFIELTEMYENKEKIHKDALQKFNMINLKFEEAKERVEELKNNYLSDLD